MSRTESQFLVGEDSVSFRAQELFVAKTQFTIAAEEGWVAYMSILFRHYFLNVIETDIPRHPVGFVSLTKEITTNELMRGMEPVESYLYDVYALMRAQRSGSEGSLLVDCSSNLFLCKDTFKRICIICLAYYNGGWQIFAQRTCSKDFPENAIRWHAKARLFYRIT